LCADYTNIIVADKQEEALQHKITSVMQQLQYGSARYFIVNSEKKKSNIISFPPKQTTL
jgi:signal transduction histidine kinase